jgi:hypothetical protein
MADVDPAVSPPPPPPPPPAPAAQTWHTGLDAEISGHAQTKGWHLLEPTAAAAAAIKAHREAESKLGAPSDRLLRLPTEGNSDEAKAFWQKLGAPADAAGYEFTGIDFGADDASKELTGKFIETMRGFAAANNLPKDIASKAAQTAFKFIDDQGKAESAAEAVRQKEERAKLEQDWGPPDGEKFKLNMGLADRAALATGMPQEVLDKIKESLGGAETARWLRHLADLTGEAKYVQADPNAAANGTMTRDQAVERRFQLTGIDAKGQRTGKGDS